MSSYCELCGRQTAEKKMVVVDGTVFNVCIACSKHGKPYTAGQQSPAVAAAKKRKQIAAAVQPQRNKRITLAGDDTMLAEDFAGRIRGARMKLGLTHEQLGMKMNEKAQLLRKFETGAFKPDEMLAKKLERFLGIKLYVSINNNSSGKDEK